jgi:hypothetical protein
MHVLMTRIYRFRETQQQHWRSQLELERVQRRLVVLSLSTLRF